MVALKADWYRYWTTHIVCKHHCNSKYSAQEPWSPMHLQSTIWHCMRTYGSLAWHFCWHLCDQDQLLENAGTNYVGSVILRHIPSLIFHHYWVHAWFHYQLPSGHLHASRMIQVYVDRLIDTLCYAALVLIMKYYHLYIVPFCALLICHTQLYTCNPFPVLGHNLLDSLPMHTSIIQIIIHLFLQDDKGRDYLLGVSYMGISVKDLNGRPSIYFRWVTFRHAFHLYIAVEHLSPHDLWSSFCRWSDIANLTQNKRTFGINGMGSNRPIEFHLVSPQNSQDSASRLSLYLLFSSGYFCFGRMIQRLQNMSSKCVLSSINSTKQLTILPLLCEHMNLTSLLLTFYVFSWIPLHGFACFLPN